MSIWEPYEDTAKQLKLRYAFAHVGGWAVTKAVVAAARGEKAEEANWAQVGTSAQILHGAVQRNNVVGMFYNNLSLRAPFSSVIEALNGLAKLPKDHPDRVDPGLRTSARRIGAFCKTLEEKLNCTNRLGLPEWELDH